MFFPSWGYSVCIQLTGDCAHLSLVPDAHRVSAVSQVSLRVSHRSSPCSTPTAGFHPFFAVVFTSWFSHKAVARPQGAQQGFQLSELFREAEPFARLRPTAESAAVSYGFVVANV